MCRPPALLITLACLTSLGHGAEVDYLSQIKPLLAEKCYSCHGVLSQESNLRLDAREVMLRGGDGGAVIVPEAPESSELITRVSSADADRMPPPGQGSPLTSDQVSLIERWIREGAIAPDEEIPQSPDEHWAFQPIVRPESARDAGDANPIDVLLNAKHARSGLKPQGEASRSLLIRRLYLDLIGLPPTIDQLADSRPWSEIVDGLLSDPRHGERWARHWMDIWRYSDWYGLGDQLRNSQKHLWHWRDWIIDAVNSDKGYDRMIHEMLAGDELAPEDPDVLAATGFLARNYYLFNRTTWLDDTIEHTSKAFLGLTINCAKCHDHKYDPITQLDYYRLRAVFEPHQVRLDPIPGITNLEVDGLPRVFDDQLGAVTQLHLRGDPKQPDTETEIIPGVPGILAAFAEPIHPIDLPAYAFAPGARPYHQEDRLTEARDLVRAAESKWNETEAKGAEQENAATTAQGSEASSAVASNDAREIAKAALVAAELKLKSLEATIEADRISLAEPAESTAVQTAAATAARLQVEAQLAASRHQLLLDAGDQTKAQAARDQIQAAEKKLAAFQSGEEPARYESLRASRKALESPADSEANYPPMYSRTSSGRRTALARWMTSPAQPLTARVAVNHVWLRHFGTPLVESVFDFGLRAPKPEHADLLDLLASELIESGWSLKHLHRLIVTSEAYRRSASNLGADPECVRHDPNNKLYWRMNGRRMESQVLRDSLLSLAGRLDTTIGGPPVDPAQPTTRRSLYFIHSPESQDKFLEMFDNADVLSCYQRSESIVPQQALALANSELSLTSAGQIAEIIESRLDDHGDQAFIDAVFETLLARPATGEESEECRHFLDDLALATVPSAEPTKRSRIRLIHSLLNHNDFITIR